MTTVSPTAHSLRPLLGGLAPVEMADDAEITTITLDSRQVVKGALFIALPGLVQDGRAHISEAVASGAGAVLYEASDYTARNQPVPCLPVENLRAKVGYIADRFFGAASKHLRVIGITGTNGKTTCAGLIAQALQLDGGKCGFIGTLGSGLIDHITPNGLTTPDPIRVHAIFAELLAAGADSVCMEVSSHALDQDRVNGVAFDVAIFTNLTRDHLDYHESVEHYAQSKYRLFEAPGLSASVVNIDDPYGKDLASRISPERLWRFGDSQAADVRITDVRVFESGLRIQLAIQGHEIEFESSLLGRINAQNLAAVATCLRALGWTPKRIESMLPKLQSMPGRMAPVEGTKGRARVVVDYAHTPDALEKALRSLREHTDGLLWVVFGCGGDRDRGKRRPMGEIARRLADVVVLTNDNPRGEDPLAIIESIRKGAGSVDAVLPDRRDAIRHALSKAAPNDSILVAGKGHETQQVIGNTSSPFNDAAVVTEILKELR